MLDIRDQKLNIGDEVIYLSVSNGLNKDEAVVVSFSKSMVRIRLTKYDGIDYPYANKTVSAHNLIKR